MLRLCAKTIGEIVYSGAIHGIVAWTIYAVIECWFSCVLTWTIQSNQTYEQLHWGFTVLLFALYPVFGFILGGLSGLSRYAATVRIQFLRNVRSSIIFPAVATLTIVLAFSLNIVIQFSLQASYTLFALLVSLLLIIALMMSVVSNIWSKRLFFITNPWTTCLVLLGSPWITRVWLFDHSIYLKFVSAIVYVVVIFLISYFAQKILVKHRIGKFKESLTTYSTKSLAFLAFVVFVVLGTSLFLKSEPRVVESNSNSLPLDSSQPNVLLIIMDTVRADHLSLYGYERDTTPNLKKLSEEATLYTHAIASSDWTLPVHASIFTGMYTSRHGAQYGPRFPYGHPLSDKFHTLAEVLSEKGYLTMGIVANYGCLGYGQNMYQGFRYWDARRRTMFLGDTKRYYLRKAIRNVLIRFASPSTYELAYRRAEDINREIFTLLNKMHETGEHFFIFVNYMDAHAPYMPPPPFDTVYPGKDRKFTLTQYSSLQEEVLALKRKVTEEEYRHMVSQYDGEIAYLDFHLGKLIARLKEFSLFENCLIIVASDHGEAFGERNLVGHGMSVYQDQVHIPLIIKYPNTRQKVVVDKVVSVVDIMPTILDVLACEIPIDVQGQSLLQPEPEKLRNVICESVPSFRMHRVHPTRFRHVEQAIFSDRFKFINSTAGKRELYDLSNDPNEKENICKANYDLSKALEAILDEYLTTAVSEPDSTIKLDKETIDRLKSLGYIK